MQGQRMKLLSFKPFSNRHTASELPEGEEIRTENREREQIFAERSHVHIATLLKSSPLFAYF